MRLVGSLTAFALACAITRVASAEEDDKMDFDTPRYEPAGFPIIGGNSDIGVEFGAATTLTRFEDGIKPYRWNADLVANTSVKDTGHGLGFVQQNYLFQLDVPSLVEGVRANPAVAYQRTINEGYFGLGNASGSTRPPIVGGDPARYFQWTARELQVRELTRVTLRPPWYAMIATYYRFDSPQDYGGSALSQDIQSGTVRGLRPLSIVSLGAGIVYDSRDNEHFPRRGAYHQIGTTYFQGIPFSADIHYGAGSAVLAEYVPIGGPFVLAGRLVGEYQIGHVPFYDLLTGGPFIRTEMPGGGQGVRGVPIGRYLGKAKAIANLELRGMFFAFTLFKQKFHFGADAFFDTGRVWDEGLVRSTRDGRGPGLKWGVGGGLYLQWGQAAIFRVEAAYSPDAVAENPKLPIGIYVQDGVMF